VRSSILIYGLAAAAVLLGGVKAKSLFEAGPFGEGWQASNVMLAQAWAQAPRPAAPPSEQTLQTQPTRPQAARPPNLASPGQSDPVEESMAAALRARREALDQRERNLATREAVVATVEQRLTARAAELLSLQRDGDAEEAAARLRAESSWMTLAKLYESMRPRDAAEIFNELDLPILVQVVNRMSERRAAPVLAAMTPERARQVTAELSRLRSQTASGGQAASGSQAPLR
jgi:flagellar motility protein MotE (MotC chaperone)